MLIISICAMSCSEDELLTFDEAKTGSSIFFQNPYLGTQIQSNNTFAYSVSTITHLEDSVIVNCTGSPSDIEREFKVEYDKESTMIQGKHFDLISTKMIIPAHATKGVIKFKFYRTDDMTAESKVLKLNLVDNGNFNVKLNKRITSNKDTLELISYSFYVDDKLQPPYVWATPPYKAIFDAYMGIYSKKKLQLMIDVLDIDPEVFIDPKYAQQNYFTVGIITYWGSYMKFWLTKEKANGNTYYDENGIEITMGPFTR